MIEAAEAGEPSAQPRLAEHSCQIKDLQKEDRQIAGLQPASVSVIWIEDKNILVVRKVRYRAYACFSQSNI
jgi:hypothetical protein